MSVPKYFESKKLLHEAFLNFFENEDGNDDENFSTITSLFQEQKITENRQEILFVLNLVSHISKNHHRTPKFFDRIEKILQYLEGPIRRTFSDLDLFDIFKNNKRILLFLFEKKLITINDFFLQFILKENSKKERNLPQYFYNEIKDHVDKKTKEIIKQKMTNYDYDVFDSFDEKCRKGENDTYVCSLIRNDSVEDFVSYYNKKRFSLESEIRPSIFETNSYLIGKKVTLIEYAAFFGAVQIFNFLKINGVELPSSLWKTAIHGKNPEMIHVLEDNHVELDDKTYKVYIEEAIKCHHNDIATYFLDNFANQEKEIENIEDNFDNTVLSYSFHYYNIDYISRYYEHSNFLFFYACKYNYANLYNILIKTTDVNNVGTVILNQIFFNKTYVNFFFFIAFPKKKI